MRLFPNPPALTPAPTRRRLWRIGVGWGLFLLTLVVGNSVISRDRAVTGDMIGHDFLAFYTAGSFVGSGRSRELYQLEPVRKFEQATGHAAGLEIGDSFGPWWNPPFYALVFEPLAKLPYRSALAVWRWIGLAAVAGSMWVLATWLPTGWKTRGLVPLLIVGSMPFVQTFSHGQNTFTSLLVLTATVSLWRTDRPLLAGIVGGLLFYKPQLAAVVAVVMVVDLGWMTAAGFAVTGSVLLAATLVFMPVSITDCLHGLPANVRWMQIEHAYLWERHVTIKSFWRLLLQGRAAGEPWAVTTILTDASLLAVGGLLARSIYVQRKNAGRCPPRLYEDDLGRDRLITATIVAMPLLMPFYFDYDLLLLAVPATLYAAERIRHPDLATGSDGRLTGGWGVLYFWLFLNPAMGLHTHVGGTVVLLGYVAVQSVRRINRPIARRERVRVERPLRRAA